MTKPYKIEVFDQQFNFRDSAVTSNIQFNVDYLTLETVTVTLKSINAKKLDLVHITDFNGLVVYDGIVSLTESGKHSITLDISPLQSLLDCDVYFASKDQYVEDWISNLITSKYITNTDTVQNLPCTVVATSQTEEAIQTDSNIINLWDICSEAFKSYGIVVNASLNFTDNEIVFVVGTVSGSITLEGDLDNVISSNFVLEDVGECNLVTFWLDDYSDKKSAYMDTSGTIQIVNGDPPSTDRIIPVIEKVETVSNFDDIQAQAQEALNPSQFNNLIELSYSANDSLVDPLSFVIGQTVQIIHNGNVYNSLYSGYTEDGNLYTLMFGVVRMELTKKLILERRKQK